MSVKNEAHKLDGQIRGGLTASRSGLWEVARALAAFDTISGWLFLGFETQGEYITSLAISRRQYYRLMAMYRCFGDCISPAEAASLETSKLTIAASGVGQGVVTREEALIDVKLLTVQELLAKYGMLPERSLSRREATRRRAARHALVTVQTMLDLLEDKSVSPAKARETAAAMCRDVLDGAPDGH